MKRSRFTEEQIIGVLRDAPGRELTAAALASGIMLWSEVFDSVEPTGGWSWKDVTFNSLGAGFQQCAIQCLA